MLCGETGSGKSTQLPKILIEMGRGLSGVIGHTQPRRIAARSVAARLSEEMNCRLGQEVGFRIRFTDSSGPNTRVRLMTDGILLAETQTDRFLDQYDTIIVDEAHERSLNIDFLLGYLKRLLPKRRDLKVIITSATIDAARFAEHFGTLAIVARSVSDRDPASRRRRKFDLTEIGHDLDGSRSGTDRATESTTVFKPAPVLQISGRMYPVDIRYRPLDDPEAGMGEDDNRQPRDWLDGVTDAVEELTANDYRTHPCLPSHRTRHSRSCKSPWRTTLSRRHTADADRNRAAVRTPVDGRSDESLFAVRSSSDRAGHECGRIVADRSRHSICCRYGNSPYQPLFGAVQNAAIAD